MKRKNANMEGRRKQTATCGRSPQLGDANREKGSTRLSLGIEHMQERIMAMRGDGETWYDRAANEKHGCLEMTIASNCFSRFL